MIILYKNSPLYWKHHMIRLSSTSNPFSRCTLSFCRSPYTKPYAIPRTCIGRYIQPNLWGRSRSVGYTPTLSARVAGGAGASTDAAPRYVETLTLLIRRVKGWGGVPPIIKTQVNNFCLLIVIMPLYHMLSCCCYPPLKSFFPRRCSELICCVVVACRLIYVQI